MNKLPRPYVPLGIRLVVAERQFAEKHGLVFKPDTARVDRGTRLRRLLTMLFGDTAVELHHRPALCNREVVPVSTAKKHVGKAWFKTPKIYTFTSTFCRYEPDANDPDFLVYVPVEEHVIETRVRGQHGDYSDLAKRRKVKRIAQKAKRPRSRLRSRGFDKTKTRKFSGEVVPRKKR
jgi:hypothetical protein